MSKRTLHAADPVPVSCQPGTSDESAFDNWLNRELSRLYDSTLQEPIPAELLDLLSS